jgi:DNA-binding IclR family transcriptional regulator
VIGRTLAILSTFSVEEPSLTLTQISELSELPITTTHRLLAQAQHWGAVIRNGGGRYWIGPRLVELAALPPPTSTAAIPEQPGW